MEHIFKLIKENLVMAGITAAGLSVCTLPFAYKYYQKNYQWKEVGYLKTIYIHTLKSGKGLKVDSAECLARGPASCGNRDRDFAVYFEENNTIQSIRQKLTKIVLVSLNKQDDNTWKISSDGVEPCEFTQPNPENQECSFEMWDISVGGKDCGDKVAGWLSNFLGARVRLMKNLPEAQNKRITRPKYTKLYPATFDSTCIPLYGDVTSFMITSDSSLRDLNSKASVEISQRSFRPNFVIDGDGLLPWAEDEWTGQVRIGEAVFNYSKDCTRCYFTRTNPENGELLPENEPLQSLKKFRQHDRSHKKLRSILGDSPVFGMHYGLEKKGTVRINDRVWVRRTGAIVAL